MIKCVVCESVASFKTVSFDTKQVDLGGNAIVVDNVRIYSCSNKGCGNEWLRQSDLDKIEDEVTKRKRHQLQKDELAILMKSLGLPTLHATAKFLNLNSKAFTKWLRNYSGISSSNDLLIRLALYSRKNFDFINYLHRKNFQFDPSDYELVCEKLGGVWKFKDVDLKIDISKPYNPKTQLLPEEYSNEQKSVDLVSVHSGSGLGEAA